MLAKTTLRKTPWNAIMLKNGRKANRLAKTPVTTTLHKRNAGYGMLLHANNARMANKITNACNNNAMKKVLLITIMLKNTG